MNSKYYGVKYYSKTDLSIGWSLEQAEKVINSFGEKADNLNINYILELYNICLLFDSGNKLNSWCEDYYESLNSIVRKFKPLIGVFCSNIDYSNITSFYTTISPHYHDTFWELFARYKIYKKVSSIEFSKILIEFNIPLYLILDQKIIVEYFDAEVCDYMKHSKSTAEILITYHLERKDWNHKKYYIPKSLCIDDQLRLIEEYIESENVNPNYLKLLYKSRSRNEFPIPDEVRLKAKKRYENYFKDSFSNESCFSFGAVVGFDNTDEVISIDNKDLLNPKIIYSHSWLKENLNNPTLLNNLVFLFGYVDSHTRSTFPSKKTELGVMEKILGVKGGREYDVGVSFDFKEMISSMQIKTYYYELLKLDKRLEEIFKWFFEEYLLVEFQVDGFILSIPSNKSSFLEKVRTLCSEIDSILRQFTNYVNNGEINRELMEISRTTPLIENIPSFLSKKYGYIDDSELLNISHQLFSDQSLLTCIENRKGYLNFERLIKTEKVKISDFSNNQQTILNLLIEKGIIYEDSHGYIRIKSNIVNILKDFYYNEVICINYYKNNALLDSLISENKIICESKLFSRPEQKYLNFILNDRQFDNGPALRNKYTHGNNPQNLEDHENHYFQLLKIVTLIIIKINEEFCLRDEVILDNSF